MLSRAAQTLTSTKSSLRTFSSKTASSPSPASSNTPFVVAGAGVFLGICFWNRDSLGFSAVKNQKEIEEKNNTIKKAHEGSWGGQGARAVAASEKGQMTHAQLQRRLTKNTR